MNNYNFSDFIFFIQQWEEIDVINLTTLWLQGRKSHRVVTNNLLLLQLTGQKSSAPESIWKGRCSSWIPQDQVSECSRRMLRPCTGQKASCPMSLRKVTCPEARKPFHQMGAQNEQTQNKMSYYIIYVCIYLLSIYLFIIIFKYNIYIYIVP